MNTCVYYTLSTNKNKEHLENHDRIIKSVMYLKKELENIRIFNSEIVYDYLYRTIEKESKEYFAKKFNPLYSDEYMEKIKLLCEEIPEDEIIDGDTYFSNTTYNEIIDNSVILYNVCHNIIKDHIKYAYCLIRPPSHHSSLNEYSGFCIVNQTYLTAKYLHDNHNKKVLILDYDVHHGDGTQKLINQNINDNIYFVSMHCYGPGFYPGTGGLGTGGEKVLNIPLEKGMKDIDYMIEFYHVVKPFIEDVNPDIIVISNGLDAHKDDPFKVMKLTNDFYLFVTKYLMLLDKPLIYILEGGYNPDVIASVSEDIINVLTKRNLTIDHDYKSYLNIINQDCPFPELKDNLRKIMKTGINKIKEVMNEQTNLAIEEVLKFNSSEDIKELVKLYTKLKKLNETLIDNMEFRYKMIQEDVLVKMEEINKLNKKE